MTANRTFNIRITSTHPDAAFLVRDAAEKIACEIGWGDDQFSSIVATEEFSAGLPAHLASWEMEPGDSDDEDRPRKESDG